MQELKWAANRIEKRPDIYLPKMAGEAVGKARRFLSGFPQYGVTPLVELTAMAERLKLGNLYVKDESGRFGLNAFKALGGLFAVASHIAKAMGRDVQSLAPDYLSSDAFRREFEGATFYLASDGNHGRAVAWSAKLLGQKAVVHMPKGTAKSRSEAIAALGATVTVENLNYDDCVRLAAAEAAEDPRGVVVQDTAWDGYEDIPTWIMQGYAVIAHEIAEQLDRRPTHVFVQAGVGSFAGATAGYFVNRYMDDPPVVVTVEAQAADCYYRGAIAGDGELRTVGGELDSIMAGLACGEPNRIAWDILKNHSGVFVSCPDWVTAKGMRMLGAPLADDARIISGESGAVGMGLLALLRESGRYAELGAAIGLGPESRVVLISTEGDTDPDNYREIVWNGRYESE